MHKLTHSTSKRLSQKGYTLVELMIVIVVMGLGTGIFATTLTKKNHKRADTSAIKMILAQSSRQSIMEGKHYGIHYDAATRIVGLFKDVDEDDIFNGTDTLSTVIQLQSTATLNIVSSEGNAVEDICFKKNGAVAPELSYQLNYVNTLGDTAYLQVIAASGQTFEGSGSGL